MTDKTIPERIWISSVPIETGAGVTWLGTKSSELLPKTKLYVRDDLALGDANEPLASGQYRWVGTAFSGDNWTIARIFKSRDDDFVFNVIGVPLDKGAITKIGPVIRPPEGGIDYD